MSLQQVNLYQDELKAKKISYSSSLLLQLCSVLVVFFIVVISFRYYQLQQGQTLLVEQQKKQKMVMAELQKIQTELAGRKKDNSLIKTIKHKTKELANKQKVIGILSQDEFGNTKGFVEHISGLARQRLDGIWLTQIRIASGGADVALYGSMSKAALLPKYLQRLSAEKAFSGTEFESLLMARQEKKKQWLNFSLQNKKTDAEVAP